MEQGRKDDSKMQLILDGITRLAAGDYSVGFETTPGADVANQLAAALNKLAVSLRKTTDRESEMNQLRKSNAELKRALEKAGEDERLKAAFFANLSYEIRTPMNGILGFTALLKKPEITGEQQQKYINVIEKSGERMMHVINDLIEISRIESGQTAVSLAPTNINEQVEFIHAFYRNEAERRGLKINYVCGLPTGDAIISTDREKIYTVLMNLLRNAIKYTQEGRIDFGYEKKDNQIVFFVKDTGIGISGEKLARIFNRFERNEKEGERQFEGAGLGLSISKAYVEMLGGKIWAESEEHTGSTFNFSIPYVTMKEESGVVAYKTSLGNVHEESNKLKILIAEDDMATVMLLTVMLEDYIEELYHVANGLEAVEMCQQHPDIDLILMDIKMSKMDGYEAVRHIRQFNKEVVIIAQTAYVLNDDRERSLKAGCNDYITKPINREALLEMINKYKSKPVA